MSWSDTIYTSNSETRTRLAEYEKLQGLLRDCFTAVNYLIDYIEETFPGQHLEKIYTQTSASFGDNCCIIIDRANKIEELLEKKEIDVEERMDTKLLYQIMDLQNKYEELIDNSLRGHNKIVFISTICAVYLSSKIVKDGYVSDTIFTQFGKLGICICFLLTFAVLCIGFDVALSTIHGEFQRRKLGHALDEYARAVEDLEPAARNWCRNILKLPEKIKMHKQKTVSTLGTLSK